MNANNIKKQIVHKMKCDLKGNFYVMDLLI